MTTEIHCMFATPFYNIPRYANTPSKCFIGGRNLISMALLPLRLANGLWFFVRTYLNTALLKLSIYVCLSKSNGKENELNIICSTCICAAHTHTHRLWVLQKKQWTEEKKNAIPTTGKYNVIHNTTTACTCITCEYTYIPVYTVENLFSYFHNMFLTVMSSTNLNIRSSNYQRQTGYFCTEYIKLQWWGCFAVMAIW